MENIALNCGCLPCLLMGFLDVHATIEHVTDRGRRVGEGAAQHRWTLGLCVWHHFGHTPNHRSRHQIEVERGPSLIWGRKPFEEHFGDEVYVLVPTQDFLLAEFERRPWPEYAVSREAVRLTRSEWTKLNHAYKNR